ncbi:MAG: hypothetical protein Q4A15_12485 [Prevotellaceae bacterium]|nr:hypothetical protein [Prevotellaceae bacterium]
MEVHGNVEIGTVIEHQVNYISGNQVFGETSVEKQSSTEAAIKEAIEKLMEEVDENGEPIFSDNGQWYAVFRVLSELHNYPKKMTDFCKVMADMDFDKCRVPCKYDSIRERNKNLPKLACKVTLWQQYSNISDAYQKQCVVANFLINILD